MRRGGFIARRPFVCAWVVFALSSLLLLVLAGFTLATFPQLGGWYGSRRPAPPGGVTTYSWHNQLVRTREGVRLGKPVDEPPLIAPPTGTVLGSVRFTIRIEHLHGWPRDVEEHWTVSVDQVDPTAAGPPATEAAAWRALVVEANALARRPAAASRGEADFRAWYPGAFFANPYLRLLHAPWWGGGAIVIAAVISVFVGRRLWSRRHPAGCCARCGYDLRGLAPGLCPECGEVIGLS
jgi:hypothetical protein